MISLEFTMDTRQNITNRSSELITCKPYNRCDQETITAYLKKTKLRQSISSEQSSPHTVFIINIYQNLEQEHNSYLCSWIRVQHLHQLNEIC
jgi:hypothetical protein